MRSVKHGGKKGKKLRYKMSAVKRQNKKQKQKKKLRKTGCEVIDKAWKIELTTRQNLAAMGLAYDPNEALNTKAMKSEGMEIDASIDEMIDLEQAKALGSVKHQRKSKKKKKAKEIPKVVDQLEKIALCEAQELTEQTKTKRRKEKAKLQQSDIEFCQKMIQRHGEDYEAMSRDPLNLWQNTPKQLERKIAVYKRSIESIQ